MDTRCRLWDPLIYDQGGATKKIRGRTGMRAWGFERRLEEEKGGVIARKCWEEMREREGKEPSGWEREREIYEKKRGISRELEKEGEKGRRRFEEL